MFSPSCREATMSFSSLLSCRWTAFRSLMLACKDFDVHVKGENPLVNGHRPIAAQAS